MTGLPKSPPLSELTGTQIHWINGGAAMTHATMPGPTIFNSQFNGALRAEFGLSHGALGGLYTLGTLASAATLIFAGGLADRIPARRLALLMLAGLALTALAMAAVPHVALLLLAFAALRFFGQGMLSHIAMTTMSRWFNRFRGRALSFAGLGFTLGEATMPFLVTLAIVAIGWRNVWLATALALVVVLAPLIAFLLRDPPDGRKALAAGRVNPDGAGAVRLTGQQWTRGRVLRDALFFLVIPGIMAPPAIGTLYIFHQAHLSALKGWDILTFTAFFPFLSVTVASVGILSGFLVDRFGAFRLMPFVLVPLGLGSLIVATLSPLWAVPLIFMLIGATQGMMQPIVGALWVELYGTAHIGVVRSLATAALVAASAIGPGIAGLLIDLGIELDQQAWGYAAYTLIGAATYVLLQPIFRARAASLRRDEA